MRLSCDNLLAQFEGTAGEEDWLAEYLTAPSQGAEHTEAFQSGRWDGRVRIYDRRSRSFPTGLVRLVAGAARESGREVELDDRRERPAGAHLDSDHVVGEDRLAWLRDYQREAVRAAVRRTRGILKAPTGSGKTDVFVGLGLVLRGIRWLVLVDTRDLLHQAAERFEQHSGGEPAGRVGDGSWEPARFTVATLQTLHARREEPRVREFLAEVEGLVVDEVQVLPAETYFEVAQACPSAYWRIGTSATPLRRSDQRDFLAVGATGLVIHETRPGPLMERGIIARPEILFVEHRHPRRTGSFAAIYEELVVLSAERNETVSRMARACPPPTLCFVRAVAHGRALARALQVGTGVRADFVSGETQTGARRAATERLLRRDVDVLVTSKIFNKGVDLPGVRGGVNAAGGASEIDALQRLGRLMRAVPGKSWFAYLDVLDLGSRVLERHARVRMAAYEGEGYRVRVVSLEELGRLDLGRAA